MEILGFVGTNKFVLISVLILLLWVSLCEAGRTKKEADAAQPAKRGWVRSSLQNIIFPLRFSLFCYPFFASIFVRLTPRFSPLVFIGWSYVIQK